MARFDFYNSFGRRLKVMGDFVMLMPLIFVYFTVKDKINGHPKQQLAQNIAPNYIVYMYIGMEKNDQNDFATE